MTIEEEVQDLAAAFSLMKLKGYSVFGLLGQSFGGGTVVLYASRYPQEVQALVLWNPLLNYKGLFSSKNLV